MSERMSEGECERARKRGKEQRRERKSEEESERARERVKERRRERKSNQESDKRKSKRGSMHCSDTFIQYLIIK